LRVSTRERGKRADFEGKKRERGKKKEHTRRERACERERSSGGRGAERMSVLRKKSKSRRKRTHSPADCDSHADISPSEAPGVGGTSSK
jgi:hypothetical protein